MRSHGLLVLLLLVVPRARDDLEKRRQAGPRGVVEILKRRDLAELRLQHRHVVLRSEGNQLAFGYSADRTPHLLLPRHADSHFDDACERSLDLVSLSSLLITSIGCSSGLIETVPSASF